MSANDRRRLELIRLAGEIHADAEVLQRIASECDGHAASLRGPTSRGVLSTAAIDLHRYYTGIENVLERVERTVGALPKASASWHRDLLWGATRALADARPLVLRPETASDLEALLAFRHFFRHAYAVEFDATRLAELVARVLRVHPGVTASLRAFADHLQRTAAALHD
jgi:hypothetical protein